LKSNALTILIFSSWAHNLAEREELFDPEISDLSGPEPLRLPRVAP
jgi:hypothetical protein